MATNPSVDPCTPVEERLQFAEALFDIVERAMSHTRATGSAIVLRGEQEWIVRTSNGAAPEVGVTVPFGTGLIGECASTRKPFSGAVEEARLDPVLRTFAVKSLIAAPVLVEGKCEGVLIVTQQLPEAFSRMHAAIMMTMATEISGALKRFESATREAPQPRMEPLPPRSAMTQAVPPPIVAPKPEPAKQITTQQNIVETLKKIEPPVPMKLVIDPPRATRVEKPTSSAAATLKNTLEDPARVAAMSLFELEAAREMTKPEPGVLCPGEDPKPSPALLSPKQKAYAAASLGTINRYTPAKKSRPMMMPMVAVVVLAIAGVAFGAWKHNHVATVAAAEPPSVTAPSPTPVSTAAPVPVANETPTPVAMKETKPAAPAKPAAATVSAETTEEDPVAAPVPAIHVAAAHVKADAPAVAAPSLSLVAANTLPQLAAPKAVTASLALKKTTVVPAVALRTVPPVYPDIARRTGTSGDVHLQLTVSNAGKVSAVNVLSGPGMLRQAASTAVSQWLYKPAMLDGRPVESTVEVTVKFEQK